MASQVDILQRLVEEEESRARAAKQLQQIAGEHPGLFERFATRFLASREIPNEPPPIQPPPAAVEEPPAKEDQKEIETIPKMPPTKAIFWWLHRHKEGTANQIVTALVGAIVTDSSKPAAMIYSTLASLKHRTKLETKPNAQGDMVYSIPRITGGLVKSVD